MRRALALLLTPVLAMALLAGCAATPRESVHPGVLPGDLMQLHMSQCIFEADQEPLQQGVSILGAGPFDVEVAALEHAEGETAAMLQAWEAEVEACVNEYRPGSEMRTVPTIGFDGAVHFLYYTGPLTACLREHGVEPDQPANPADFRSGTFATNPYWMMHGDIEHLLEISQDCPPSPDFLEESG